MRKRRGFFNKSLVLCIVFGLIACFGMDSLSAEVFVVAQAPPSQPREPAITPPPASPQPSNTGIPSSESPASSPSLTIPPPGTPASPSRRRLPVIPPGSPTAQPPTPTTPLPSPSTQTQPSLPASGQEPTRGIPAPPPRAAAPGAPAGVAPARGGSGVVFNFDNADIYEVIRVMSEILKINYIIDPRVKGVVNIHTSGQISSADVFPIFQSILRLNGATAVKKNGIYQIVPLPEAKKLPAPLSHAQESGK